MLTQLPVIVQANISPIPKSIFDPIPQVEVVFDDGKTCVLFSYFPEEMSFTAEEFIGLTRAEAMWLYYQKDLTCQQSCH